MGNELVIVPSRESDYVELSRTKTGRIFKKHILTRGALYHPHTGAKIEIDDEFVDSLKANFTAGVCDIVQVPVADKSNQHTEDPKANIGEVVDLTTEGDKVYAHIDVRDPEAAKKLGVTMLGASALIDLNYLDSRKNQRVGPTLLHTLVTNRPYVVGLEDYREIVAASADSSDDAVVMLSDPEEPEMPKTLEELLAELKTAHGIDVSDLQAKATTLETVSAQLNAANDALSAKEAELETKGEELETKGEELAASAGFPAALAAALGEAGVVRLSNGDRVTPSDVLGMVSDLAKNHLDLSGKVIGLERKAAETMVDGLIGQGRILPAERDARVELRLSNSEMFDRLLPAKPIVPIGQETGVGPSPEDTERQTFLDKEILRLTAPDGPLADYVRK